MSKTIATKGNVYKAAESLLQDGINIEDISVRMVTKQVGGGSPNVVGPILDKWRKERLNQHNSEIPMPLELSKNTETFLNNTWYTAVKCAREYFESKISENTRLHDDINEYIEQTTELETSIEKLTNELADKDKRFITLINANQELFFKQSSKIEDALATGDLDKINTTFNNYFKLQREQFNLVVEDQQKLLSNYMNSLEINDKDFDPTAINTNSPADLKQSAKLVEASITEADKVN